MAGGGGLAGAKASHATARTIVDEAGTLTGAMRAMWVAAAGGVRSVATARLPTRECPADLRRAVTPWLREAQHTRQPRLRPEPRLLAPQEPARG